MSTNTSSNSSTSRYYSCWPAEWESHWGCIILYPHNIHTFRLHLIQQQIQQVILAIAGPGQEHVIVLCTNENQVNVLQQQFRDELMKRQQRTSAGGEQQQQGQQEQQQQEQALQENEDENNQDDSNGTIRAILNRIHLHVCPSNDTWARDTAPTFVIASSMTNDDDHHDNVDNTTTTTTTTLLSSSSSSSSSPTLKQRTLIGLDWQFNAYGGKYTPYDLDQQLASRISCDILPNILTKIIQSEQQQQEQDEGEPPLPPPPPPLGDQNIGNSTLSTIQPIPPQVVVVSQSIPLILEGGSIHTDGQGTIITTKECLLNPNRNPSLTQEQIELMILQATGCTHMIWLENGLPYDHDTNGHIDNFCCFVQPGHVLLAWTNNENNHPDLQLHYIICRQAYETLQSCHDANGQSLTIHKLHIPSPPIYYTSDIVESLYQQQDHKKHDTTTSTNNSDDDHAVFMELRPLDRPMAASYLNFYIANQAVIVPQFNDPIYDPKAIETLQAFFPNRQIIGVLSTEILIGGGNIHCITQQIPI